MANWEIAHALLKYDVHQEPFTTITVTTKEPYRLDSRDVKGNHADKGNAELLALWSDKRLQEDYSEIYNAQATDEIKGSLKHIEDNLDETVQRVVKDKVQTLEVTLSLLGAEVDENQAGNLQNQINQLTADNQVVSITHNLGKYPDVQVLYWEYGLGTVPLEEQPEGISFDGTAPETIPVKVVHPSRNRMQIQVPIDYAMTNPVIKQIKNNEYVLTEGIKSMKILIGVI